MVRKRPGTRLVNIGLGLILILSLAFNPALADTRNVFEADTIGDANALVQVEMMRRQIEEDYKVSTVQDKQVLDFDPVYVKVDLAPAEVERLSTYLLQVIPTSFPSETNTNYYRKNISYDKEEGLYIFDIDILMSDRSISIIETENEFIRSWVEENLNGLSDLEKIKAIHDFVVLRSDYYDPSDEMSRGYRIYDASAILFGNGGVCQAYTVLFSKMASQAGLDSIFLYTNQVKEDPRGHTWNYVYAGDRWLHLDATNNDRGLEDIRYDYFLVEDEGMEALGFKWDTNQQPKDKILALTQVQVPGEDTPDQDQDQDIKIHTRRIAGDDRVKTALEVSKIYRESASTLIVARGDSYADALSASILAGYFDAPIVLSTAKESIEEGISDEIKRLGANQLIIIGGYQGISQTVEASLEALPELDLIARIAGEDRYETSALIVREFIRLRQGAAEEVIIASGESFPDALAASAVSSNFQKPIVLVRQDQLTGPAQDLLMDFDVSKAYIVGGKNTISPEIYKELEGLGIDFEVIGGVNRYETSARIAGRFMPKIDSGFLASGLVFPDSLVVGGVRGKGPILLTDGKAIPPFILTYIKESGIKTLDIIGGTSTISSSIENKLN